MTSTSPSLAVLSFPSKGARLAYFKEHISTHLKWALRTLEVIYQYQTEAEKAVETTTDDNGVGFAGTDATILTSFAKQYAKWKAAPKYPTPFSEKQAKLLHRLLPKYAGQLLRHLESTGKAPAVVKPAKRSAA